jgi:hypothetical protein
VRWRCTLEQGHYPATRHHHDGASWRDDAPILLFGEQDEPEWLKDYRRVAKQLGRTVPLPEPQGTCPDPPRLRYYRSRADFVAYLAVRISETSENALRQARDNAIGDLGRASAAEIADARKLLAGAGIRMMDDSPPAWHFAKAAFRRGAYD